MSSEFNNNHMYEYSTYEYFIGFSTVIKLYTWRIRKVIGFDKIFVLPTISSS